MKFLSWIFIFTLVFFFSCQGKKTSYSKERSRGSAVLDESEDSFNVKEDSKDQKDKEKLKEPIEKAPAIDSQDQDQTTNAETAQATSDETAQAVEDETAQAVEDETAQAVEDETAQAVEDETAQAVEDETVQVAEDETAQVAEDETVQVAEDETAQAVEDETAQAVEDETAQAVEDTAQTAKCNIHNYKEYVYDYKKVNQLIAETGQGCYLPGVDFSNQDLTDMVFTQSNLRGAIFRNTNMDGAKFIKVDCTGCALEDSSYMEAYWRGALLKTATYNWYDFGVAWIRLFSGQGIRNPEGRGMIYTGE